MTEVTIADSNGEATVTCTGDMDLHAAEEFKDSMERGAAAAGPLTVDFRQSIGVDSTILQILLVARRKLAQSNRGIRVLVAKGGQPAYVLKTLGFDGIMDVVVSDKAMEAP